MSGRSHVRATAVKDVRSQSRPPSEAVWAIAVNDGRASPRGYAAGVGWTWQYQSASGDVLESEDLPRPSFPTQADAESWIGETWQELLTDGVSGVVLLEDGAEVYGPMSLLPPD